METTEMKRALHDMQSLMFAELEVFITRGDGGASFTAAEADAIRARTMQTVMGRAGASVSEGPRLKQEKDAAYHERNLVVAALTRVYPAGVARTAIEGWSKDWHGCVYIDLPTGQVSWHFHDSETELFAHLPSYNKPWDGHDTPEKYRRLAALRGGVSEGPLGAEPTASDTSAATSGVNAAPRRPSDVVERYDVLGVSEGPASPRKYDGPPTVRALNRVADRIEDALHELLPHTFASLVNRGNALVAALREEAANELEEQWPK